MRRSVKHKIYLESDGFLNSLSKWMILSTVMTVAMAACGGKGTRGSGSSAAPAIPPVNHNASGGEQPSGAPPSSPPTKPPPTLDLNVTELSPNGCLDLQRLAEQSGQFPSSSYVREYTRSVLVTSAPPPGAALARFRNMEAEVAFANFSLRLQPSGNFAAGMPAITQTG
jgi:hypothetical protein